MLIYYGNSWNLGHKSLKVCFKPYKWDLFISDQMQMASNGLIVSGRSLLFQFEYNKVSNDAVYNSFCARFLFNWTRAFIDAWILRVQTKVNINSNLFLQVLLNALTYKRFYDHCFIMPLIIWIWIPCPYSIEYRHGKTTERIHIIDIFKDMYRDKVL